jgi:hypothetical protein
LDLDFWPENRTLVKSAAAESDFGFGLGLRALPCWEAKRATAALPLPKAASLSCRRQGRWRGGVKREGGGPPPGDFPPPWQASRIAPAAQRSLLLDGLLSVQIFVYLLALLQLRMARRPNGPSDHAAYTDQLIKLQRIRDRAAGDLSLPQLCVVGDQTSGKGSLLGLVTGI